MSFSLSTLELNPATLVRPLHHPTAGACVTFEGWVRDHNEGLAVRKLEYESFVPLAEQEGHRIIEEARRNFELTNVICVHRIGMLEIGDLAIWVGVSSAHRAAAFEACRFVIDETKARVPIWKKEHYLDGTSEWINCAVRGEHSRLSVRGSPSTGVRQPSSL